MKFQIHTKVGIHRTLVQLERDIKNFRIHLKSEAV